MPLDHAETDKKIVGYLTMKQLEWSVGKQPTDYSRGMTAQGERSQPGTASGGGDCVLIHHWTPVAVRDGFHLEDSVDERALSLSR